MLLNMLGRPFDALASYRQTLGQDVSDHLSSIDLGILGYKTRMNMAGILIELGNYAEAKEHLQAAIQERPGDLDLVFALFNAAVRFGDTKTAHGCLDEVEAREGRSENWHRMMAASGTG